jgi:peptide-methionine (S)-S-oxide reductase
LKRIVSYVLLLLTISAVLACTGNTDGQKETKVDQTIVIKNSMGMDTATFGAGCFWCVEAIFQRLNGVEKVQSGYSGGHVKNPSYKEVCTGLTGHAEVLQIVYDPKLISFEELLEVFWKTHDPTTLNRQGGDVGTQYRSAIFYHSEEQKQLAETYKQKLNAAHVWDQPVVTEIVQFTAFYPAEDYHNNYFNLNGEQGYCRMVIAPKVEKFEKVFKSKLKH